MPAVWPCCFRAQSEQQACGHRKNASATRTKMRNVAMGGGWQCRMLIALEFVSSYYYIHVYSSIRQSWWHYPLVLPTARCPPPPTSILRRRRQGTLMKNAEMSHSTCDVRRALRGVRRACCHRQDWYDYVCLLKRLHFQVSSHRGHPGVTTARAGVWLTTVILLP